MSTGIAITGLGTVLPCGDGVEAARASWEADTPCFQELPGVLGLGCGAWCDRFNPMGIIPPLQLRRLDRASRFAWSAAHQALQQAHVEPAHLGPRFGLAVGSMSGGSEAAAEFMGAYFPQGPEAASPMLFPNCVAAATCGHLSKAFRITGPGVTFLEREASAFSALEQAQRWIRMGFVEAALVVGTDSLFPLLMDLLSRAHLLCLETLPEVGSGKGFLPGEGAQAFLLENLDQAESRGARILARLHGVASFAPASTSSKDRAQALAEAANRITPAPFEGWIGGSSGHPSLDGLEHSLAPHLRGLPSPRFPKMLWGEFCGSGGQLLAAALLESRRHILITAPSSSGSQYAAVIEND